MKPEENQPSSKTCSQELELPSAPVLLQFNPTQPKKMKPGSIQGSSWWQFLIYKTRKTQLRRENWVCSSGKIRNIAKF